MTPSENPNPLEERHYTIPELAKMWNFSTEFVRQIVRGEPGVTEWVRQAQGRRRYRVLRVPRSVAERLYRQALTRADVPPALPRGLARKLRARSERDADSARLQPPVLN